RVVPLQRQDHAGKGGRQDHDEGRFVPDKMQLLDDLDDPKRRTDEPCKRGNDKDEHPPQFSYERHCSRTNMLSQIRHWRSPVADRPYLGPVIYSLKKSASRSDAIRLCFRNRFKPTNLDGWPISAQSSMTHPVGLRKRLKSRGRSSFTRSDTVRAIAIGMPFSCATAANAALSISRPTAPVRSRMARFSSARQTTREVDAIRPVFTDIPATRSTERQRICSCCEQAPILSLLSPGPS